MAAYELVLSEAAAMALVAASRTEQRRLSALLDRLKADPFRRGDLQERDAQGRANEIWVEGDWIVTYWPDHAVREMRVVRIEQVED
ncbi:MAG: hypothetical protein ACREIA_11175 [Opitutaceae bacterium]